MENKGDPGPSKEELEDLISEELDRIFRRYWWRESMEQTLFSRAEFEELKRQVEELKSKLAGN